VDIGAFSVNPSAADYDKSKILFFQREPVHSGKQVLHFITAEKPKFAGMDPYNEWIDRNSDDNIVSATAAGGS
jgi:hypothetical protein